MGKELATLKRLPVPDLRAKYVEVFGEATNTWHKAWLVKRTIWRMQALAEGDLTERARRRAAELANDADLRRRPPKTPTPLWGNGKYTRTGKFDASELFKDLKVRTVDVNAVGK